MIFLPITLYRQIKTSNCTLMELNPLFVTLHTGNGFHWKSNCVHYCGRKSLKLGPVIVNFPEDKQQGLVGFTEQWWFDITLILTLKGCVNNLEKKPTNIYQCTNDYCQTSNISHTLQGNDIGDHSDVVGASPVGAAPTTSSFSTGHPASTDWAKTTARREENHFIYGIWCSLY